MREYTLIPGGLLWGYPDKFKLPRNGVSLPDQDNRISPAENHMNRPAPYGGSIHGYLFPFARGAQTGPCSPDRMERTPGCAGEGIRSRKWRERCPGHRSDCRRKDRGSTHPCCGWDFKGWIFRGCCPLSCPPQGTDQRSGGPVLQLLPANRT